MFGGDAFIYTFGDSVGRVMLTGLAFSNYCSDNNQELGIERVAAYYNANRLSFREEPIFLTVGSRLSFKLYLAGIETKVEDPAQQIWRFDMMFLAVPPVLPRLQNKDNAADDGNAIGDAGGVIADAGGVAADGGADVTFDDYILSDSATNYDSGGWSVDRSVLPLVAPGFDAYKTGTTTPKVTSFVLAD
jgi:hypothetical protein